MMVLRILFLAIGLSAIAGTAWLGYYGIGRDSTDLDRSVRAGSAGRVIGTGGRIK
ncbi:hypothetical protein OB2597_08549 [Pseudooceanicola batsensis HTCC2597]|uniref:Histidine kinase n=1 Tax=Pseudooceanicola batsensis (strain ATCC BAA-863 / DSM 15984 / KCTC 12145 / HTCC2597) TaxID=252305 RepID=A3TUI2_PSEBH|nr:hypothetical protein [Pseudooceanicola batsensis]EAQ04178.1 hypothetical protein OB2597_08549 [Pseudooceanicola batsensis HTCC2597]